jgi:hypothetical protein
VCDRFLVGQPARAPTRTVGAPSLALAAVAGAGAVAMWLGTAHLRPPVGPEACVDQVLASFPADEQMTAAAERLADDDRIAELYLETQSLAYERARRIFRDQTELLDLMRPETLPASVMLLPGDGGTPEALADQLRTELPAAVGVRSYNPCAQFHPPT